MKEKRPNPNLEGMTKCVFCGKYIQDKAQHPCYMPRKRQQQYSYRLASLHRKIEDDAVLQDYRDSASISEFRARLADRREAEKDKEEYDSLVRAQQDIKDLISEYKDAKRKKLDVKFI